MVLYNAIADEEIAVNKPITNALMTKIRDNPLALNEGLGFLTTTNTYVSPEQAATAGGTLTLNHGLTIASANLTKAMIDFFLICKSNNFGYITNDVVPMNQWNHNTTSGAVYGVSAILTTTQLKLQVGNGGIAAPNRGTNAFAILTPAKWRIVAVVRA